MEIQFTDEDIQKLPPSSVLSTNTSDGSLNDVQILKQSNESLRKELDRVTEECREAKKIVEQLVDKDTEIEALKLALEKVTHEKDDLQKQLSKIIPSKALHKPVSNPLQTALIDLLVAKNVIKSKEVEEVMRSIDRGDFAPKEPYNDRPQQIGFNTTISAPHMHASQLEILKDCFVGAKKGLDIGTGSGYVALSLVKMMKGEDVKVYAVDHIPKLVDQARENVGKNHKDYIDQGKIEFIVSDGREGLPQHAPFDIMFIGGAVRDVPTVFLDQLAPGGSMLIPVGEFFQYLMVIHKTKTGKIEKNPVMSVLFGKLQSVEEQCPELDE
jgi:protein-L-isoaspartate(D-aspartate) O-methyltransferase